MPDGVERCRTTANRCRKDECSHFCDACPVLLQQRLRHVETDVETLIVDPMIQASVSVEEAEAVGARVQEQLDELLAVREEVSGAQTQRRLAEDRTEISPEIVPEIAAEIPLRWPPRLPPRSRRGLHR